MLHFYSLSCVNEVWELLFSDTESEQTSQVKGHQRVTPCEALLLIYFASGSRCFIHLLVAQSLTCGRALMVHSHQSTKPMFNVEVSWSRLLLLLLKQFVDLYVDEESVLNA